MYNYDRTRTASTAESILRLIVKQLARERDASSLVQAYLDEVREDWEEGDRAWPDLTSAQHDAWMKAELDILSDQRDMEKRFADRYVSEYIRRVRGTSRANAMEVMDPPNFPPRIPGAALDQLATTLAMQDATDALALREMALSRGH